MKEIIWETKATKYFSDFKIYLNVGVTKDYNPQELNKDLEDFIEYLIAKYKETPIDTKLTFVDWLKLKLKV